jgi:mRNA interferase RelE/StbE
MGRPDSPIHWVRVDVGARVRARELGDYVPWEEVKPPGCTKLTGEDDTYRVRVGVYRIVYEVLDKRLLVHIVRIGHRRDVYRA